MEREDPVPPPEPHVLDPVPVRELSDGIPVVDGCREANRRARIRPAVENTPGLGTTFIVRLALAHLLTHGLDSEEQFIEASGFFQGIPPVFFRS
jgi:hypothetical protein